MFPQLGFAPTFEPFEEEAVQHVCPEHTFEKQHFNLTGSQQRGGPQSQENSYAQKPG